MSSGREASGWLQGSYRSMQHITLAGPRLGTGMRQAFQDILRRPGASIVGWDPPQNLKRGPNRSLGRVFRGFGLCFFRGSGFKDLGIARANLH